jgi:hypothetical protein
MSTFLRSLGFVAMTRGSNIAFTFPGGGPVILLPAYKCGQAVKPIHRMMVKKQLTDAGLLRPGPIMISKQPKALPKLKAKSRSRKKLEI